MRLLCLVLVGLAFSATCAAAGVEPVEAPDLEAKLASPYGVYCADVYGLRGAWGVAAIPQGLFFLDDKLCAKLRGPLAVDATYALALQTALHEMTHVGWRNESESGAECFSLFIMRWEARHRFGATVRQANGLYELAWGEHLGRPADYQGCRHLSRDPLAG
jgi:hypothetical protein